MDQIPEWKRQQGQRHGLGPVSAAHQLQSLRQDFPQPPPLYISAQTHVWDWVPRMQRPVPLCLPLRVSKSSRESQTWEWYNSRGTYHRERLKQISVGGPLRGSQYFRTCLLVSQRRKHLSHSSRRESHLVHEGDKRTSPRVSQKFWNSE